MHRIGLFCAQVCEKADISVVGMCLYELLATKTQTEQEMLEYDQ